MKADKQVEHAFEDVFSPDSRAAQVRAALAKIRGLELVDGYRGVLSVGSQFAELRLEPNDGIQVRFPISLPETPTAALVTNGQLPANVRFARNGHGDELLADTQVDGKKHLPETLRQIRGGIRAALRQTRKDAASTTTRRGLTKQQVQEALDEMKRDPESMVRHEDAWELRPTVPGESIPVRVELHSNGIELVMHRTILARLPPPASMQAAACADQALRFNSQLRLVRLAHSAGTLVCEARLHAGQLQPTSLATTARAVAFASRHVQLPLRVLAEQESVAQSYVELLGSSQEPDTMNNVAG